MPGIAKKLKRKAQQAKDGAGKQKSKLVLKDHPETDEFEIQKQTADGKVVKRIRFPKKYKDQAQMMPDEFKQVQNAIEALKQDQREVEVYADSIESKIGYDSLLRAMGRFFGKRVAYYHSKEGGSLSLEEARKAAYKQNLTNEQASELIDETLRMPADYITFQTLLELNDYSPAIAENIWEMMKRDAQMTFESGHRASEAMEPADYMRDAWNRASYLGLRESLCEEWQPKGGIELTMIDAIAQAWLQLQFWTEESVRRAKTEPRRENHQFYEWKLWNKQANPKQWIDGHWDIPYVYEQEAVEHAAQMADRWQRMYFRAIRNLRDWRRYSPQVTINNAQQVNIAADGGQQVNVSKSEVNEGDEGNKINS